MKRERFNFGSISQENIILHFGQNRCKGVVPMKNAPLPCERNCHGDMIEGQDAIIVLIGLNVSRDNRSYVSL